MIPEAAVWTIFFLPLGAFLFIALVVRPFFNNSPQQSGLIAIIAIGGSLALSAWALQSAISASGGPADQVTLAFPLHEWVTVGSLNISLGVTVDPLTSVMLVVATGVSLMVQIYSLGYMRGDPGYSRYFAIMCLFTASMAGLVISSNIVQMYVFWELVGVCSYLLIGFWFNRPAAAAAAKKAFIVTRIGDFGFLIAILYLFFNGSSLAIADINAGEALPAGMAATWLAVGIFAGAVGKSAQFPLHVWLPDAMEGPTPVSALIHAATMVAAGVFLVARFFPVFENSTDAMTAVAMVGAFTAIFAATMGLVMNDIKRVLAYSTVSQLGYMIAALGIGAYPVAIFHLFNHAFFKALLFMGAGSVNHATGTFDMRYMGGLRRIMPWTYITMVIGSLSLVGIFPFAGFWSKDEILLHAWRGDGTVAAIVFWLLMVSVFLTAVYSFRMIYMTFHGEFKGGASAEAEEQEERGDPPRRAQGQTAGASHEVHLAESPVIMVLPMLVLAVGAVVSGYVANPLGVSDKFLGIEAHWFSNFVTLPGLYPEKFSFFLAVISVGVGVAGMAIATAMHLRPGLLGVVGRPFRGVHKLLSERYYMDHLYEGQIVYRGVYRVFAGTMDWFDSRIVDNVAEFAGWVSRNIGRAISVFQTGQVQGYAVVVAVGVTLIVGAFLIWGQ